MRRGVPLHRSRALFEKLSDEGPLMPFPRGVARASPPLSLSRRASAEEVNAAI